MANPNLENGYTPLANELLEALSGARLNGTQLRILLLYFRNSYGFHRKDCALPLSYLCGMLGGNKSTISKEIGRLVSMRILERKPSETHGKEAFVRRYSLQKDYELWRTLKGERLTVFQNSPNGKNGVGEKAKGALAGQHTYKNTYNKYKYNKPKKESRYDYDRIQRITFLNVTKGLRKDDSECQNP